MKVFAADPTGILGNISPPFTSYSGEVSGLIVFVTNIIRLAFLLAGIWAFINIILAGYSFLSSGGDPKAINSAWQKIWFTIVGLMVIVASFLIAALVGLLLFNNPLFIFNPVIYGPK